ncbi:ATP-binding protein [Catellatospora tritici]|uniref:ATP-binding protein n=1 Tax=Catellatospora tritici TaxID=2851566 RepID=UPI001C2D4399|nr:ATP-binding protein [Catellatospora tritici]MBV1850464.1 ATP-binding protein [Catellatospora tritici]
MTGAERPTTKPESGPATDAELVCEFTAPDLYSLRAAVGAHAAAHGMVDGQLSKLLVVVTELAANAIRHGGGRGRLRLWRVGDALRCEVTDGGPGIGDPDAAGVRPVPVRADGGRGLWIVRQFSDQVTIISDLSGTAVTAVLHL